MRVLGIESSCDDTAAAVYDSAGGVLSNVVSSQVPIHAPYGGGVPAGPGLIGSLLVGLCFAKSLAYAWGKPLYGADHLEAHIYAIFLEQEVEFPFVALLVSGGHTSLFRVSGWDGVDLLGGTRDDAAGGGFGKGGTGGGRGGPGGGGGGRGA